MSCVGIIVNPFSGKDLRRITTSAMNVSNVDKADKAMRIINSMGSFKTEKVFLLPDNFLVNSQIAGSVNESAPAVELLDFPPMDNYTDTLEGIAMMLARGICCLVVLGGDGTCRLAAKAGLDVPLLPVSTGTNNVYPEFWEGTTIGIAAAYIAAGGQAVCTRSKMISVYLNGVAADVALVDAAITKTPYIGSKVIPSIAEITQVVVCKCSPELIGLSALVGSIAACDDTDDYGYAMQTGQGEDTVISPINPGELTAVRYVPPMRLGFDDALHIHPPFNGTIALDGERTLRFLAGDHIEFRIRRDGPLKADIKNTLRRAVEQGFLRKQTV